MNDKSTSMREGGDSAEAVTSRTAAENESQAPREPLRMRAYYFGFAPTGVELVDRILSAVAHAGKGYHHTDSWSDDNQENYGPFRGTSYVEWIQHAAEDAAHSHADLLAALKALYDACMLADSLEELPPEVDGLLLDAAYVAIQKAEAK